MGVGGGGAKTRVSSFSSSDRDLRCIFGSENPSHITFNYKSFSVKFLMLGNKQVFNHL